MFNINSKWLFILALMSLSHLAQALPVEAQGQAVVMNGNLTAARQAAIEDASRQASMQAAVYVSASQQVRDGILEIDDMKIATLGTVSNVEVLRETLAGNLLTVLIRADVLTDEGCSDGTTKAYLKRIAITGFPLLHPAQGNLGGLGDMTWELPNLIASRLAQRGRLQPLKATHLSLYPALQNAASRQLDDGTLTSVATHTDTLDSQFIVSGVIRDLSMVDPTIHAENNYFIDLYNRLDYRSNKHLRAFQLDLFVHDGFSGALLSEKRYEATGIWNLDPHLKTGFNSQGFAAQEYGQAVHRTLSTLVSDLEQTLRCKPLAARITRTENNRIWLQTDQSSGVKQGDKFRILHRSTFYDVQMRPTHQLSNTHSTLVVDEVHPTFAVGHLINVAQQQNILPGDIALSY
jgi:hypothetical protein